MLLEFLVTLRDFRDISRFPMEFRCYDLYLLCFSETTY